MRNQGIGVNNVSRRWLARAKAVTQHEIMIKIGNRPLRQSTGKKPLIASVSKARPNISNNTNKNLFKG